MRNDLHEDFSRDWPDPPSERSTGLVFAAIAALVALFHYDTVAVWLPCSVLALTLGAVSWWAPYWLRPVNLLWFRFSLLLSQLVNPLVMSVLYALIIVPFGLVMQLCRDPLHKRRKRETRSYWEERSPAPSTSMRNQF